jgi:hypothetical protein
MANLKNAKVYRGGITAQGLSHETSVCTFDVNKSKDALDFRFSLASKGGGVTLVMLRVGIDDLSEMLHEVATKMPEQVGLLSDCAAVANRKNLEALFEARRVARAEALIEKLKKS